MEIISNMTSPHNFTLDRKTEKIYEEFQELAHKHKKTVSDLIRTFIIDYVEANNPVAEPEEVLEWYELKMPKVPLLTHRTLNPHPKDSPLYSKWNDMYAKVPKR